MGRETKYINPSTPITQVIEAVNRNTKKNTGKASIGQFNKNEIDQWFNDYSWARQWTRDLELGHTLATYLNWTHVKAESGYSIWKYAVTDFNHNEKNELYYNDILLAYRGLATSELSTAFDSVLDFDGVAYNDQTAEAGSEFGTPVEVLRAADNVLYIGSDQPFAGIDFEFETLALGLNLSFEYSKGASVWGTPQSISDETGNFSRSGRVTFIEPIDFATDTVNGVTKYWVKITTSTAPVIIPQFYFCQPLSSVANVLSLSSSQISQEDWAWCFYNGYIYVTIRNDGLAQAEGLTYVKSSSSQSNKENFFIHNNVYMTNFEKSSYAQQYPSQVTALEYLPYAESPSTLDLQIRKGRSMIKGIVYNHADQAVTVPANEVAIYVYIDEFGVITASTSVFPPISIPIAICSSDATKITAVSDQRTFINRMIDPLYVSQIGLETKRIPMIWADEIRSNIYSIGEIVRYEDAIIELNYDFTTGVPTEDMGLRMYRGDEASAEFLWKEDDGAFDFNNPIHATGDIRLSGDLVPDVDATQNIGRSDRRISTIFMASVIDYATDLSFSSSGLKLKLKTDGAIVPTTAKGFRKPDDTGDLLTFENTLLTAHQNIYALGNLAVGTTNNAGRITAQVSAAGTYGFAMQNSTGSLIAGLFSDSDEDSQLILKDKALSNKVLIASNGDSYINAGNFGVGIEVALDRLHVVGNIRGQSFIDHDNPLFYLDPSGTSVLNAVESASLQTGDITANKLIDAQNVAYYIDPAGSSVLNTVQAGDITANRLIDAQDGLYIMDPAGTSNLNILQSVSLQTGDITANKLIDAQNVAYYIDPAGSSVLNTIQAGDITANRLIDAQDGLYILDPAGTSNLNILQSVSLQTGDITANKLIDAQNSSYYIDPAGSSVLNTVSFTGTLGPIEVFGSNPQIIIRGDAVEPRLRMYSDLNLRGSIQSDSTHGMGIISETMARIVTQGGAGGTTSFNFTSEGTMKTDGLYFRSDSSGWLNIDTQGGVRFYLDSNNDDALADFEIHLDGSSTADVIYTSTKFFGVGTNLPITTLHTKTGIGANNTFTIEANPAQYSSIHFYNGTAAQGRIEYNNATDRMEFRAGGTSNLFVLYDGKIGSGIATPTTKLDVRESGPGAIAYFNNTNVDGYGVSIRTTDAGADKYALLVESNNGATKGLIVTNSGQVAIGTTNPISIFHIVQSTAPSLVMQYSGQRAYELKVTGGGVDDGLAIIDNSGAAEIARFTRNGFLGVGTNSPDNLIHVSHSTNGIIKIESTGLDSQAQLLLTNDARTWVVKQNGSDQFVIRDSTAPADRLIINTSGFMGVGIDPEVQLHVNGTLGVIGTNALGYVLAVADGTTYSNIYSNKYAEMRIHNAVNDSGFISIYTRTSASNTERMRITNSGHLGFGTTDVEAWNAAYRAIEWGRSAIIGNVASETLSLLSNAYIDAVGYKYKATGAASMYLQNVGGHYFRVTPSGGADGNITWNNAFSIINSGYVGVGTTNPLSNMHVSSTGHSILTIDSGTGSDAQINFSESTTPRWSMYNYGATDEFRIVAPGNSTPIKILQTGDIGFNAADVYSSGANYGQVITGSAGSILYVSIASSTSDVYYTSGTYHDGTVWKRINDNVYGARMSFENGKIYFATSGTGLKGSTATYSNKFYIGNDGKVGIGTTVPSHFVQIYGDGASSPKLLHVQHNGVTGKTIQLNADNSNAYINFSGDLVFRKGLGTGMMVFKDNGAIRFITTATPGTPEAGDVYSDGSNLYFYNGSAWDDLTAGGGTGYWTQNGSDIYYNTGKVGIGITAPLDMIHIHTPGAGSSRIRLTDATAGSTATDGVLIALDSGQNANFLNYENANLHLGTNGAAKLTITPNGHVGVGISSLPSWSSLYSVIHLGGNGAFMSRTSQGTGSGAYFYHNAYFDGTNDRYISNDEATVYSQDNGRHLFRYAASGVGGNAITWNTGFVITNIGYIGIGTSNPDTGMEIYTGVSSIGSSRHNLTLNESNTPTSGRGGGILFEIQSNPLANIQGWWYNTNQGHLAFFTMQSGTMTEGMRINHEGRVGIGTSLPAYTLDMHASSAQGQCSVHLNYTATNGRKWILQSYVDGTEGKFGIYDSTGSARRLTIDPFGNVGINTSTPYAVLNVVGSSSGLLTIANTNESVGQLATLTFSAANAAISSTTAVAQIYSEITQANPSALKGDLVFRTNAGDLVQEVMRITGNKYVGINTTNPLATLGIVNQSVSFYGIRIFRSTATTTTLGGIYENANGDAEIYLTNVGGSTTVKLETNGASYFTGGYLGIGESNPAVSLQVYHATNNELARFSSPDADTTVTNLTGARITIRNSNSTVNNYAHLDFKNANDDLSASIVGKNVLHGTGTGRRGELSFCTLNGNTVHEAIKIDYNGTVAMDGGTGFISGPALWASKTDASVAAYFANSSTGRAATFEAGTSASPTAVVTIGNWTQSALNSYFYSDGAVRHTAVYNYTVGGTNRDLFIDSNGYIGYVSSSIRYKTEVEKLDEYSKKIYKLRPVSFEYKKELGVKQFGLIAEEVNKVIPELVSYNDQGDCETVLYSKLIPLLLNEVQRLDKRVKKLEKLKAA